MRNRGYDPDLQRFLAEDPIGLAGGINSYTFVGNSPMEGRDPSGLCPQPLMATLDENGQTVYKCPSGSGLGLSGLTATATPQTQTVNVGSTSRGYTGTAFNSGGSGYGFASLGGGGGRGQNSLNSPVPDQCGAASPMSGAAPNPYPDDYTYRGIRRRPMFEHGGDGAWGQAVRSCLVCAYESGVAPAPAHSYCYAAADMRVSTFDSVLGYTRAIATAAVIGAVDWLQFFGRVRNPVRIW